MIVNFGKLKYATKYEIEFDRYWNAYTLPQINQSAVNRSMNGVSEVISFYNKRNITLQRDWIDGTLKSKLEHWYEQVKDGTPFEFWLNETIAKYINFERGVITDSDGTTETVGFARTGVANYLDPHTGLITELADGEPPIEAGKFGDGLLLDHGVQASPIENLITVSEDLTNPAWVKSAGVNITGNDIDAPDGNLTADKYASTASATNITYSSATAIGTNSASFSVWVRVLSGTRDFTIRVMDHTGTDLANQACTATTTWQRFKVTYISTGSNANNWAFRINLDINGANMWVWGAQGEVNKWVTSYAANGAARNKGTVKYDLANFDEQAFSVSFWHKPLADEAISEDRRYLNFHYDGVGSIGYLRLKANGDMEFAWARPDLSGTLITSWSGTHGITKDEWHYFVIAWDTSSDTGLSIYIDGVKVHNPTLYAYAAHPCDVFYVGSSTASSEYADGIYDEILFENKVLNQAEVTARYNRESALGVGKNYYSSVRLVQPATFNMLPMQGSDLWIFTAELEEVIS